MKSEIEVIIENSSSLHEGQDIYQTIARGILNALGKELCEELVKKYDKDDEK